MTKAIYFDMDGTIANLYAVENWLPKLRSADASPYEEAVPMVRMNLLAKLLNRLQREGYIIGIVSWLSKNSDDEYDEKVTRAKMTWLETHLASVNFDEIHIVKYGTPKQTIVDNPLGILFDDEEQNREKWLGTAHDVDNIIEILKSL